MNRIEHRIDIMPDPNPGWNAAIAEPNVLDRVWNAVVDFFTWIIDTIADWYRAIVNYFYMSTQLRTKLAPFTNMPQDPDPFLDRAIAIHEELLGAAAEEFEENFEVMSNPNEVAYAILRAYLFAGIRTAFPFFNYVEKVQDYVEPILFDQAQKHEGAYPVFDAQGQPVMETIQSGGPHYLDVPRNFSTQMRDLQNRFQALSELDREAILDKIDFEGIEEMPISNEAKAVLRALHTHANQIQQGYPSFTGAIQGLHGRFFSA